jgi:hypothetical protein
VLPLVAPFPFSACTDAESLEHFRARRRVTHEIEQVIEPAARIGRRPTVQFGLHPRYPLNRARCGPLQYGAAIRRRVFGITATSRIQPLSPFPM